MTSVDLIAGVLFIALSVALVAFSVWIFATSVARRARAGAVPAMAEFEFEYESESAA